MNAPFRPADATADLDVAIVGAGFSGLCMAIALKKAGYKSFRVFEKAADLGGTWWENRYPGCACDVPSHLYSFSFEQNPGWSRAYSPAREIWQYMRHTAEKYGLLSFMRFNAAVSKLEYDEAAQIWHVSLATGETIAARAVISGAGALHLPAFPKIKNLQSYRGPAIHSAQWDDTLDFQDKRVAVIGTGASAIQLVPALAGKVKQLYLFQRTPSWILPRMDRAFSPTTKQLFRFVPGLQRFYRSSIYWLLEARAYGFTRNVKLMKAAEKMARGYLAKAVPDPKLRQALTPNYTIGCKRVLVSDDFYPAMSRANVELVTTPIAQAQEDGLLTTDGKLREVDAIIYATGFRVTEWLSGLSVIGRNGRKLCDDWKGGAEAYYGITTAGYPNFFMLLGPNTGLGHNSIIFMIEAQVRYTMDCLKWLLREGVSEVEVRADRQKVFNAMLKTEMKHTVWQSGCKSWYLNEDGSSSIIWPGFTVSYWRQTHSAKRQDFVLTPASAPVAA